MSRRLHDYVGDQAAAIAEGLAKALKDASAPHYQATDDSTLQGRTRRLVDAFVVALDDGPHCFVGYVRDMAEERIAEGFFLPEIQTVLSLLEQRVWHMVVDEAPIGELVSQLGCVTTVVGEAKDELARVYLQHLVACEATAAQG